MELGSFSEGADGGRRRGGRRDDLKGGGERGGVRDNGDGLRGLSGRGGESVFDGGGQLAHFLLVDHPLHERWLP